MNNPEFTPFIKAAQYKAKLPLNTSGWYLPCIAQWKKIHECFFGDQIKWKTLKFTGYGSYGPFATSSICNGGNAWAYELSYITPYNVKMNKKSSISNYEAYNVRAVAAF